MTLARGEFELIKRLMQSSLGISLGDDQNLMVSSRLKTFAISEGLSGPTEVIGKLTLANEDYRRKVVESLINHETSFFRDARYYHALGDVILPRLIDTNREKRKLTIWSAGCSTGQEPYSLAMLLHTQFPLLSDWKIRIIATDVSEKILSTASKGEYSSIEMNRGLPARYLTRYFDQSGNTWRISSEIKKYIEFQKVNLNEQWPFLPQFDLCLMRNVMVYFLDSSRRDILSRLHSKLEPHGILMVGTAEPIALYESGYQPHYGEHCVYYGHKT